LFLPWLDSTITNELHPKLSWSVVDHYDFCLCSFQQICRELSEKASKIIEIKIEMNVAENLGLASCLGNFQPASHSMNYAEAIEILDNSKIFIENLPNAFLVVCRLYQSCPIWCGCLPLSW